MALLLILNMQLVEKYNLMPMYEVLRHYSNHNAAVIFLAQAGHESGWGKSNLCKKTRKNWWGVKSEIYGTEYQIWYTYEQAARRFTDLLKRKYPNALRAAKEADIEDYVYWLKKGGYFEDSEERYLAGVKRYLGILTKKEAKDGK